MALAPPQRSHARERGAQVSIRGVSHSYGRGGRAVAVLHDVDLEVKPGGSIALTGPSGAGKSTLLSLIGGLEPVRTGEIRVGGHDLASISGDGLAAFRRDTVGFVFQHYGLVDVLSARENIELSLALSRMPPAERRSRADWLLASVGLAERAHHRPTELSGGERQRVAIARALANRPRLLLADEPTGNLDEDTAAQVLDLLGAIHRDSGCTLIIVTHDRRVAERASTVRRLSMGRWVDP